MSATAPSKKSLILGFAPGPQGGAAQEFHALQQKLLATTTGPTATPPTFDFIVCGTVEELVGIAASRSEELVAVVAKAGTTAPQTAPDLFIKLESIRNCKCVFRLLYSRTVSNNPRMRQSMIEDERFTCHMISHVESDTVQALASVLEQSRGEGTFSCPLCGKSKMTQFQLWYHLPMFHIAEPNQSMRAVPCPVCHESTNEALLPHFHDNHAPPGTHLDARRVVNLYSFALCVIQRPSDKKFLVVQEYCNQGYWLPGGGIDPAEDPQTAAKRECKEEAGIDVELTGVLRVEVTPGSRHTRLRFIFFGRPLDEKQECKTMPDFESVGSCWVTAEEVTSGILNLRGPEPTEWFNYVAKGGKVYPLSVVAAERDPVPKP